MSKFKIGDTVYYFTHEGTTAVKNYDWSITPDYFQLIDMPKLKEIIIEAKIVSIYEDMNTIIDMRYDGHEWWSKFVPYKYYILDNGSIKREDDLYVNKPKESWLYHYSMGVIKCDHEWENAIGFEHLMINASLKKKCTKCKMMVS